jgi:hypothetical protein
VPASLRHQVSNLFTPLRRRGMASCRSSRSRPWCRTTFAFSVHEGGRASFQGSFHHDSHAMSVSIDGSMCVSGSELRRSRIRLTQQITMRHGFGLEQRFRSRPTHHLARGVRLMGVGNAATSFGWRGVRPSIPIRLAGNVCETFPALQPSPSVESVKTGNLRNWGSFLRAERSSSALV